MDDIWRRHHRRMRILWLFIAAENLAIIIVTVIRHG